MPDTVRKSGASLASFWKRRHGKPRAGFRTRRWRGAGGERRSPGAVAPLPGSGTRRRKRPRPPPSAIPASLRLPSPSPPAPGPRRPGPAHEAAAAVGVAAGPWLGPEPGPGAGGEPGRRALMRLRALRRRAPCTPGERRGAPGEAGGTAGTPGRGSEQGRGSLKRSALPAGPEARPRGEGGSSLDWASPSSAAAWAGGVNALPRWAAGALGPVPTEPSLAAGRHGRMRGARGGQSPGGDTRLPLRLSPPGGRWAVRSCEWSQCSLRAPSRLRSCAVNLREFGGFGRFSWMSGAFPHRSGSPSSSSPSALQRLGLLLLAKAKWEALVSLEDVVCVAAVGTAGLAAPKSCWLHLGTACRVVTSVSRPSLRGVCIPVDWFGLRVQREIPKDICAPN